MNSQPSRIFSKTKEISSEQFISIWNLGGTCDVGNQFSNADKADYLECNGIMNVNMEFDAGYVLPGIRHDNACKWKAREVMPLPENWEEVYLVYRNYPHFQKVLVARNNHDGTVQVFKF